MVQKWRKKSGEFHVSQDFLLGIIFYSEKIVFSRAHVTRGRIPWDSCFFAFTTFTRGSGKRRFFDKKKERKATFTECHASKQQPTFKNVGRISKKVRRFSENVGEKKKNVGAFLKKTPTFFGPFR